MDKIKPLVYQGASALCIFLEVIEVSLTYIGLKFGSIVFMTFMMDGMVYIFL